MIGHVIHAVGQSWHPKCLYAILEQFTCKDISNWLLLVSVLQK